MIRPKITMLAVLFFSVGMLGCSSKQISSDIPLNTQADISSDASLEISSTQGLSKFDVFSGEGIENIKITDENEYYKVLYHDFMYYYYIFDENHEIIKSDGPLNKHPHISMINDDILKFTLQSGTGLATQWGFYYDTKKDIFSQNFTSIYTEYNEKIAYCEKNKIIIRDAFDKTNCYQEIASFSSPLSAAAEPITNIEFLDDGTFVKISYLAGDDYREVSDIFSCSDDKEVLDESDAIDILANTLQQNELKYMVVGIKDYMDQYGYNIRAFYDEGTHITTKGFYLVLGESKEVYKSDILCEGYTKVN